MGATLRSSFRRSHCVVPNGIERNRKPSASARTARFVSSAPNMHLTIANLTEFGEAQHPKSEHSSYGNWRARSHRARTDRAAGGPAQQHRAGGPRRSDALPAGPHNPLP